MKHFFFLLAVIMITSHAYSQTGAMSYSDTNKITTQRWKDTCFGLIDKSSSLIPSGILMDYSLTNINDSNFNSQFNSNLDTVKDGGQLFSILSVLNSGVVNANGNVPNSDSLFLLANQYARNNSAIPITFVFKQFQKIRRTALAQGLFTVTPDSVRLKDVVGRSSSPYDTRTLFAFAPLRTEITQFNAIKFALPAQLWQMPGVTSVTVDFGDGKGPQAYSSGAMVNVYYPASGRYLVKATISTSSGSFSAKSLVIYTRPTYYSQPDSSYTLSVAPQYTSASDYVTAHGGSMSVNNVKFASSFVSPCSDGSFFNSINCGGNVGATVHIFNGCDHVFDKPIYIITGFDALGAYSPEDLSTLFNDHSFVSNMKTQGYDFVLVTFTDNTTFIENNASVLEAVINRVNTSKSGNNRGAMIGWSMGGLVARWALKDMEDKGQDHQISKYFSYDAPHQGANVPLGMQCFYTEMLHDLPYLAYSKSFQLLDQSFHSYAAQQMLVTYAKYSTIDGNNFPAVSTLIPVRAAFAQALIDKGYPQNLTKYGITLARGNNGSGARDAGNGAQWNNFNPGSPIFATNISWNTLVGFTSVANAVPEQSNGPICYYLYSGLKVVKIFGATVPIGYYMRSRNIKYSGTYPYDDAPGGYETTQTQFATELSTNVGQIFSTLAFGGSINANSNYNHLGHSFVALASALDLQNQGYSSANRFQSNNMFFNVDNSIVAPSTLTGNNLSTPSLSPFQYVLTSTSDCGASSCSMYDVNSAGAPATQSGSWNQWHEGQASTQVTNFLLKKIQGSATIPVCSSAQGLCSQSLSIVGPIEPCNSGTTYTYSLSSIYNLSDVSVQWTFTSGRMTITGGQGTKSVTAVQASTGGDVVKAVLTNSCGNQTTLTLAISVGGPKAATITTVNVQPCPGTQIDVTATIPSGSTATSYKFYVDNVVAKSGSGRPASTTTMNGGSCGSHNIYLQLTDACGSTNSNTFHYTRTNAIAANSFTVSPNPATNVLLITSNTPKSSSAIAYKSSIYASDLRFVQLTSTSGTTIIQKSYSAGTTTVRLELVGIKPGFYVVTVSDGIKSETHKVILSGN